MKHLKSLCFFLILLFMVWGLYTLRDQLTTAFKDAHWGYLSIAFLIAMIYLLFNASVWGLIIQIIRLDPSFTPRRQAAFLWIECEAMRWLPGGIWGYASRVIEAKRIGMNKTQSSLSLALELLLTILAWALLGGLGVFFSPRLRSVAFIYLNQIPLPSGFLIGGLLSIAFLILLVVFSNCFSLRSKLVQWAGKLWLSLYKWKISIRALLEYLLLSLFYSLGFLLCMKGIEITPLPSLLEAGGAYGLAWIIGFFAFGAPGGLGVREGVLYLVYEPLGLGAEVATAAILWRAIQIIAEISLFIIIKTKKLAPK